MNTLIVQYLPRAERSHTASLLEAFMDTADPTTCKVVDLCTRVPDMFVVDNVLAYIHRNYMDETISSQQQRLLDKADAFCEDLLWADKLVLAFPMHNFSEPAIVKAWFDSVIQKGKTFAIGPDGYKGLLKAKKALILLASGGTYEGEAAAYEHAVSLATVQLGLMGIGEVSSVCAAGMNLSDGNAGSRLDDAVEKVRKIAEVW